MSDPVAGGAGAEQRACAGVMHEPRAAPAAEPSRGAPLPWWKRGVIYQIYPRSFADSNGDGTGDLPGITAKLDYLARLGVAAIWLSPVYRSPMADFGYDISDYRGIDPIFGTLADFDALLSEAHRRSIRIVMDLVLNHTSDRHPWFVESRSSRASPKRDWYVWRDGAPGKAPNNWMASFGGRAWEWDTQTGQYYLHSFLREQPDLNWRNPEVKEAAFAEIRFWLDRGVDGFRLDVINWLVKDELFRSNPYRVGPTPRPYDLQRHLYDRNRPETHQIVREMRSLVDSYGERMLVGEVYSEPPGDPALSASYLGCGDELHLAFDFSLAFAPFRSSLFASRIKRWMNAVPRSGWPCHVLSNHDQPRSASRFSHGARRSRGRGRPSAGSEADARNRVAAFLLLTLRGTPFLYYGEELGMRNGRIRRDEIVDPIGKRYWPLHHGRDGERTPMQWSAAPEAGFTTGTPWLPVNRDFREINVERESEDPASLLSLYRRLIALRAQKAALVEGEWEPVAEGERDVVAYLRGSGRERLLIALNFARSSRGFSLTGGGRARTGLPGEALHGAASDAAAATRCVLLSTHREAGAQETGAEMVLAPYEATIWEMADSLPDSERGAVGESGAGASPGRKS